MQVNSNATPDLSQVSEYTNATNVAKVKTLLESKAGWVSFTDIRIAAPELTKDANGKIQDGVVHQACIDSGYIEVVGE